MSETEVALEEDKRFLSDLEGNCANNRAKDENSKTRSDEIAIADAIKILDDDDALELFKKTLLKQALCR